MMIPGDAVVAGDVYKAGVRCASLWRVGDEVTFRYVAGYDGAPVASTLPVGSVVTEARMQAPAYFAGLLPEGETRRRTIARWLHVSEDDELGLLTHLGLDTIGDVQIVDAGAPLPDAGAPLPDADAPLPDADQGPTDLRRVRFADLWLPDDPSQRSAVAGVQPKISYHSRSLVGGRVSRVILKFSPDDSWHGVLRNEQLFMTAARAADLDAPNVEVVADAEGVQALAVSRFDRSWNAGTLVRHAQQDATQVLGLRPAQKYDPDARTVIGALSQQCTAPPVAARDLLHQMLYSYAIGNNDLHAKNLSIGQDPFTGVWAVTPVYDVLYTWPYEGDHRFYPAIRDTAHDAVTRRHWLTLAADIGVPAKVAASLCTKVTTAVGALIGTFTPEVLEMPEGLVRDMRRRVTRRVRDLEG